MNDLPCFTYNVKLVLPLEIHNFYCNVPYGRGLTEIKYFDIVEAKYFHNFKTIDGQFKKFVL